MMLYRGIEVTYEGIRDWVSKFSNSAANQIRRNHPKVNDKWHLDEVRVIIKGEVYWLLRAVDSEGRALDILIQKRRNTKAAKRLIVKLLKKQGNSSYIYWLLVDREALDILCSSQVSQVASLQI